MTVKIQIKTRLHDGIYRSQGGGQTRVVAEWNYGPRNLVKALRFLWRERRDNARYYGNIGCGHSWLCTTDGRTLDASLVVYSPEFSHAELVKEIESCLMTEEQHKKLANFVDAQTA